MKKSIQIPLNEAEKACLRKKKIRQAEVAHLTAEELVFLLEISSQRAKDIHALCVFQKLPSIGVRFAEDLIEMGIYSLEELKGKNPVHLLDTYEKMKGAWYDPCLEDQFRLIVYYANGAAETKQWWDFTAERKAFRAKHGYPADRPKIGAHLLYKKD
jgi:hypothetical protein